MCAPSDGKNDEVLWFEKREVKERVERCAFFYLSLMRVIPTSATQTITIGPSNSFDFDDDCFRFRS